MSKTMKLKYVFNRSSGSFITCMEAIEYSFQNRLGQVSNFYRRRINLSRFSSLSFKNHGRHLYPFLVE